MWFTNNIDQSSKKVFLFIVIFIAMNKHIHAQFYNHSPNDTIKANAVWEDGNAYNIKQINSSVDTLYFKWSVVSVSLPIGWEASICDNKNSPHFFK